MMSSYNDDKTFTFLPYPDALILKLSAVYLRGHGVYSKTRQDAI